MLKDFVLFSLLHRHVISLYLRCLLLLEVLKTGNGFAVKMYLFFENSINTNANVANENIWISRFTILRLNMYIMNKIVLDVEL